MRKLKLARQINAEMCADKKAVSLMLEYIILAGILSVFVVILSLQLNDALERTQVDRVIQNQFSDVAAQISTLYTDYILIRPSRGEISTTLTMLPQIGDYSYLVTFRNDSNSVYLTVKTTDERFVANSSLGFRFFLYEDGIQSVRASGESLSVEAQSEAGEKPELRYEKRNESCDFIPKPRLVAQPTNLLLAPTEDKYVTVELYFTNADEIGEVEWNLTYWGGEITNSSKNWEESLPINWTTILSASTCSVEYPKATCWLNVTAWQKGKENCSSSFKLPIFVTANIEKSPPELLIGKWSEPSVVGVNEPFEIHIRLEGRGFTKSGGNLSVVQVLDVSGSMIETTQYEDFKGESGNENVVTPKIVAVRVNLSEAGQLMVYAYTNDTLPDWYSNDMCKVCDNYENNCPWYGKGYADEFVKLEVDGDSASAANIADARFGKYYSQSVSEGWHTIRVVARAPDAIDLKIEIASDKNITDCDVTSEFESDVVTGTKSCSVTIYNYTNYKDLELNLPPLTGYLYMRIDNVSYIPKWEYAECPDSSTKLIDGYCGRYSRYVRYESVGCGIGDYSDGNIHSWVVRPGNYKEFLLKRDHYDCCVNTLFGWWCWEQLDYLTWYYSESNYGTDYYSDYFIEYPDPGTYKIRISPLTFTNVEFTGKAYIERLDAAKVAAKTFNNMLGDRDFVGLVKFSTDASRTQVNSSPLMYMTTDKTRVNDGADGVEDCEPTCATDPAEALYNALKVFPIWNESGNNCTECINNTRPLVILLTDGRPTTCNYNYDDEYPAVDCPCTDDDYWSQIECMADFLKNTEVNGYNITLCTIGFGPDVDEDAQTRLKNIASLRPDKNEKCYFFAETSQDLVAAFREIYNIFRIAAKDVVIHDTVNTTLEPSLEVLDVRAYKYYSNFTGDFSACGSNPPCWDLSDQISIGSSPNGTVIQLSLENIKIDEVVEIIITAKVQKTGVLYVNHPDSWVEYTSIDITGEPGARVTESLTSNVYIMVIKKKEPSIILD